MYETMGIHVNPLQQKRSSFSHTFWRLVKYTSKCYVPHPDDRISLPFLPGLPPEFGRRRGEPRWWVNHPQVIIWRYNAEILQSPLIICLLWREDTQGIRQKCGTKQSILIDISFLLYQIAKIFRTLISSFGRDRFWKKRDIQGVARSQQP